MNSSDPVGMVPEIVDDASPEPAGTVVLLELLFDTSIPAPTPTPTPTARMVATKATRMIQVLRDKCFTEA